MKAYTPIGTDETVYLLTGVTLVYRHYNIVTLSHTYRMFISGYDSHNIQMNLKSRCIIHSV
jgi:hypothetical protein